MPPVLPHPPTDRTVPDPGAPAPGLSRTEAAERLADLGPNRLEAAQTRPGWLRFLDQFRSPLVLILLGAAALAAAVGDLKDPVVIGVVVLANAVIGFVQERRADRSLDALRSMLTASTRVRRDGEVVVVPTEDVVPGDVVLLEAGERIPADARLVVAHALETDEAILTGEALPVAKLAGDAVFMQTVVTRGRGEAVVEATGMATEVGRIAALLRSAPPRETPLQRRLHGLTRRLTVLAGVAVAAVIVIGVARGDDLGTVLVDAVALAVAAIPEGLPAVVTVTLAIGAHRMARRRAVVRRLASVETLGATTAICTDKTGTLTRNRMTATEVWTGGAARPLAGPDDDPRVVGLARAMVLANDAAPAPTGPAAGDVAVGDPTEVALLALGGDAATIGRWRADAPRLAEIPFDATHRLMATAHPAPDGTGLVLLCKGAPDAVLERCSAGPDGRPLDTATRAEIQRVHDALAADGRRILAAAVGDLVPDTLAGAGDGVDLWDHLQGLRLLGLVALVDPPRPEARTAVACCHRAGIAVKMITGDHATTAAAIARDLGIRGGVRTGTELEAMSDAELREQVGDVGVFARVSPEHKVRIVRALRERGEVVAMTGDGVNDAPALEHADIGVAMGRGGTEVAKEAADLVLTDDNFATIVDAVNDGRTIFDNIVKFVRFQVSTNVGAIVTIVGASVLGLAAPFTAIQILWVNLIMDGPPAIALGVDPPAPDTMERPPRDPERGILDRRRTSRLIATGTLMATGTLAVLALAPDPVAPTMAFTVFVLLQVVNALMVRRDGRSVLDRHTLTNGRLWAALGIVTTLQVAAVQWSPLQGLFETRGLGPAEWGVVAAVTVAFAAVEELVNRTVGARIPEEVPR